MSVADNRVVEDAGSDVFANLACGHHLYLFHSDDAVRDVLISEEQAARRKDGWFAAPKCAVCLRRRRVVSVSIRACDWMLKDMTVTFPASQHTEEAEQEGSGE